jgi:hypothetical protein
MMGTELAASPYRRPVVASSFGECRLAWALAETASPFLAADQRNEMFVAIGVGHTFAAIRLALDVISRAHCSVEGRTAAQLHAWLNAYTCHDDAPQLRHWIGRVTAAH